MFSLQEKEKINRQCFCFAFLMYQNALEVVQYVKL